jgi:hypothetical protein
VRRLGILAVSVAVTVGAALLTDAVLHALRRFLRWT